jgi:hypothetical protein
MESEFTRPQAVRALLSYSVPLAALKQQLAPYPWDSEEDLAFLTPSNVVDVLRRFVSDQLTAADVEAWADCIEGREDVGFEAEHSYMLAGFVFDAANPDLNGAITSEWAEGWIERLS